MKFKESNQMGEKQNIVKRRLCKKTNFDDDHSGCSFHRIFRGVQVVRHTSNSADWRRDCGKGPFLDGI